MHNVIRGCVVYPQCNRTQPTSYRGSIYVSFLVLYPSSSLSLLPRVSHHSCSFLLSPFILLYFSLSFSLILLLIFLVFSPFLSRLLSLHCFSFVFISPPFLVYAFTIFSPLNSPRSFSFALPPFFLFYSLTTLSLFLPHHSFSISCRRRVRIEILPLKLWKTNTSHANPTGEKDAQNLFPITIIIKLASCFLPSLPLPSLPPSFSPLHPSSLGISLNN